MKHASNAALDDLEDLLAAVRLHATLVERKRGIFYRKSIAFLHFHEDPVGIFADLKTSAGWSRMRVSTAAERRLFLAAVRHAL